MRTLDLIRHGRNRRMIPQAWWDPFASLHEELDRWLSPERTLGTSIDRETGAKIDFLPRINVAETDHEVTVSAELPGLEEKDVELELTKESLILRGEKKTEKEEDKKNYHYQERSFGAFYREIVLPDGIDTEKAKATFKKGVLEVKLPKSLKAQESVRKVPIQGE